MMSSPRLPSNSALRSYFSSLSLPADCRTKLITLATWGFISFNVASRRVQLFGMSSRQRQNFVTSAGTNDGGLASFVSLTNALSRPRRLLSGTPMYSCASKPSGKLRYENEAEVIAVKPAAPSMESGANGDGVSASSGFVGGL